MPRPCKRRRVCAMPGCRRFSPAESSGEKPVELSVDEFETVRLIDYEALDQAACAERMGVARTTVQAIHSRALGRIAAALVEGRELEIGGGDFFVCDGSERMGCGRHACCCQQPRRTVAPNGQEGSIMRIAVPYDNGQVFQHFGHTRFFAVYDIKDGNISSHSMIDAEGSGHSALGGFLRENGVDLLICGGIGGGAKNVLAEAGIDLISGVSGNIEEAVKSFIGGILHDDPDADAAHHTIKYQLIETDRNCTSYCRSRKQNS